jgi:shikimate dehydrogenase
MPPFFCAFILEISFMAINGKTQLLGVIGHPVTHSLSPAMHNAAIAHLNANYVYLPLPVKPEDLQSAIAGFRAINLQGFSITIPHKQAIIPLLSEVTDIAQAIGAVNTVYPTANGWGGTNTDITGFLAPLLDRRDWSQTTAVVLGNGGAARAIVMGCRQLGCGQIFVVGRNLPKLQDFRASWADSPLPIENLSVHGWDALPKLIPQADLLVNTTPIGMHPQVSDSPLTIEEGQQIKRGAIAYDLIYTPRPTRFLEQAEAAGAVAIDGLEMLVQQGAVALERWLQQAAPIAIMRQALLDQLKA